MPIHDGHGPCTHQQLAVVMAALQIRMREWEEWRYGETAARRELQERLLRQEEKTAQAELVAQQERSHRQMLEGALHRESAARQEMVTRLEAIQEENRRYGAQMQAQHDEERNRWRERDNAIRQLQASRDAERTRRQEEQAIWEQRNANLEAQLTEMMTTQQQLHVQIADEVIARIQTEG